MRIVTRPDLDGIVCAVLLFDAETITKPVLWVEPNAIKNNLVKINSDDIISNLPYHRNCAMWFDHHYSNNIASKFKGRFKIAPSAAGVIYEYYNRDFNTNYVQLVHETDRIDSADLSIEEVSFPEKFPYLLLSMTISSYEKNDVAYWNRIIDLLRKYRIETVMSDTYINHRCNVIIENNILYKRILTSFTKIDKNVAITDLRSFRRAPSGNRFLVYSLYPETNVQIKIFNERENQNRTVISIGHSIFNRSCKVNIGHLLRNFEGGGHIGAGSCSFHKSKFDLYYAQILSILKRNIKNDD